jgi:hypothetical protein
VRVGIHLTTVAIQTMRVRINQPRPDCLIVEQGTRWPAFASAVAGLFGGFGVLALVPLDTGFGLALIAALLPALAVLAIVAVRSARSRTWTLVRTQGRLLVDGEPLELARVELRVRQMPVTKVPTGYSLSLWLMTSSGPLDVPLGAYQTLLHASEVSGTVEEFVQRANTKQPGHTGA